MVYIGNPVDIPTIESLWQEWTALKVDLNAKKTSLSPDMFGAEVDALVGEYLMRLGGCPSGTVRAHLRCTIAALLRIRKCDESQMYTVKHLQTASQECPYLGRVFYELSMIDGFFTLEERLLWLLLSQAVRLPPSHPINDDLKGLARKIALPMRALHAHQWDDAILLTCALILDKPLWAAEHTNRLPSKAKLDDLNGCADLGTLILGVYKKDSPINLDKLQTYRSVHFLLDSPSDIRSQLMAKAFLQERLRKATLQHSLNLMHDPRLWYVLDADHCVKHWRGFWRIAVAGGHIQWFVTASLIRELDFTKSIDLRNRSEQLGFTENIDRKGRQRKKYDRIVGREEGFVAKDIIRSINQWTKQGGRDCLPTVSLEKTSDPHDGLSREHLEMVDGIMAKYGLQKHHIDLVKLLFRLHLNRNCGNNSFKKGEEWVVCTGHAGLLRFLQDYKTECEKEEGINGNCISWLTLDELPI